MTSVWITSEPKLLAEARRLMEDYQAELGVDLCFQKFDEEMATLPGRYAPPTGALMLVSSGHQFVGCGALRDLGDGIVEVKRMYLAPEFRGQGGGRWLLSELLAKARELGYENVRLDTLRRLEPALRLYESAGFKEIPAYNPNPEDDIVYLELAL